MVTSDYNESMNIIAGPICEGLQCIPLGIPDIISGAARAIPIILISLLVISSAISFFGWRKTHDIKTARFSTVCAILAILLIGVMAGQSLVARHNRQAKLSRVLEAIDFDTYISADVEQSKLIQRYVDYVTNSSVAYMTTVYETHQLYNFKTSSMNLALPKSLNDCGVQDPLYRFYFKKCELIGQTKGGQEVRGSFIAGATSNAVIKFGETSVVMSAKVPTVGDLVSLFDNLQVANKASLSYPNQESIYAF